MRTSLLTLLLFIAFTASTQDLTDSLSKYSYLIQIKTAGSKMQATGFFARHQQRLFFVTAAHCVTGWNPFEAQKVENFPDTIFIRMSNDTSHVQFLPMPVAGIKQRAKPFREYESPDVYVIEIKNPKAYPVYSVEKYFEEQVRCETAKSIWVSGYPYQKESRDYFIDRQQPLTSSASLGEAYCLYPFRPEAKRPDELNYFATLDGVACAGLAGSPAYLLTDDKRIVFGGIYIGGADKALRTGMVVRPEYVVDKIISQIQKR
jgi:hypothetical protein